jgi:hypothetical protein
MKLDITGIDGSAFALMARAHKLMHTSVPHASEAEIRKFDREIGIEEVAGTSMRDVALFERVLSAARKRFTIIGGDAT